MRTIDRQIDDGRIKFTFTNLDGEVFAYFLMNPTDVGLAERSAEVADFFSARKDSLQPGEMTAAEMAQFNKEIEERIDYLLGYNASDTLFANLMTATTILPSGNIFAVEVLDVILEAVQPEMEKRKNAVEKYTAEYA